MEWLNTGMSTLKDLLSFLYKKSKTNDTLKKQVIIELRNNLNIFKNGYMNNTAFDNMIGLLETQAFEQAIKENFNFKKLKPGVITAADIFDERNRKYAGWSAERLCDKIAEKIFELRNIKKMNNNTVTGVNNNIGLMMSNLYFRMKLLADCIRTTK